ncbi:MAG TPA: glyoxalase [Alphaproteobacteria bacterium]|nr:glyoxalase [Alphaproteobacteria bacterium]
MLINSLDHCSIRTTKLQETRQFFVDILGLEDGKRPDFPFPGAWLYTDSTAVIHLIGVDPDDPSGLQRYVGGEISSEALQGSGAFDHIAFRANDPSVLIERLKKTDYAYRERQVPNMNLFQIFVEDPNGITIELNYRGEEEPVA